MEMEKWKSGRKIIVKARRGLPQVAAADGECSMVMMMMVMMMPLGIYRDAANEIFLNCYKKA